ncbi:hypothetical protein [Pseudomonas aeruginosa]|uniref:Uncharacterized protein n=1 Tax=Pseudomonas phage Baskent_P1_112 TaxID=3145032 RepID=A0AAU8B8Z3_9CAUD|nr:hypothetical protein [Pseudomonas aeruginosa]MBW6066815.1 hypothetical protein [Pseudomonas aeruginosa]QYC95394.1 hypothetical protein [Pseudomonas phage PhL_UNISO_PA-DSM_ph0041x]BDA97019.1 hypothetical protein [Pseudomonas phage vB_PaS-HSN4]
MKKYVVNIQFQDTKVFYADFYRIEGEIIRFFQGEADSNPLLNRSLEVGAVRGWTSVEEKEDGQ